MEEIDPADEDNRWAAALSNSMRISGQTGRPLSALNEFGFSTRRGKEFRPVQE